MLVGTRRFSSRLLVSTWRQFCVVKPPKFKEAPHISSEDHYEELYEESIENPESFWSQVCAALLVPLSLTLLESTRSSLAT